MSALKRVTMTDTAPRRRNPFSALRETQIIDSKPFLPAGPSFSVPESLIVWPSRTNPDNFQRSSHRFSTTVRYHVCYAALESLGE